MKVYLGAEHIISPLGNTAEECFARVIAGDSGISQHVAGGQRFNMAKINRDQHHYKGSFWQYLLKSSVEASRSFIDTDHEPVYVVSSAKGEIENIARGIFGFGLSHSVKAAVGEEKTCYCISNACISGLLAINFAQDLIQTKRAKTVVISGVDVITDFVVSGFNSLYALDRERCRPFDKTRSGLNLGEGVGTVVMSSDPRIFRNKPVEYIGGFSNNDANHISGPSRTGEGLKKAVKRALDHAQVSPDFISAHGTGTAYNDAMEAQAFYGLGLDKIPVNSLKSFFGHTLGAAGIIESIISVQALRNDIVPGTLGLNEAGTDKKINVLSDNLNVELNTFLKTCSGFGGGNAAGVFQKL